MKFGITGQQYLKHKDMWIWVKQELRNILFPFKGSLLGISSFAKGSDQIFIESVLELNGKIYLIIPYSNYISNLSKNEKILLDKINRLRFKIKIQNSCGDNEIDYYKVGRYIVDNSDVMISIWDGKISQSIGGTSQIVEYALSNRKKIIQLNPTLNKVIEFD